MKLYLKKSDCTFRDSVNGEVVIVETDEPVFFEDGEKSSGYELIPADYDMDGFVIEGYEPFVAKASKDYKI